MDGFSAVPAATATAFTYAAPGAWHPAHGPFDERGAIGHTMFPTLDIAGGAGGGRDSLTAALARPFFVAMLEREVVHADQTGKAFSLCLLDVDGLKKVNARAGFRVGDVVLAGVADAVRQELKAAEWRDVASAVARYDGDALAVMLRRAQREGVQAFAARIAAGVAAVEFVESTRVNVSVAAVVYEFGESVDALLAKLERTLHVCKQFGEGRIEIAPSGGWERAARTLSVVGGSR
jgi:diguanylate cyclase (GGDEF)-like protein